MTNTFYFEDRVVNLFNEYGERVHGSMEGILIKIRGLSLSLNEHLLLLITNQLTC